MCSDDDDYRSDSSEYEWECYLDSKCVPTKSNTNKHKRCELVFANLNDQRINGLLCDATLSIGLKKFPVHKNILRAASPYFNAMFSGSFVEKTEKCIEIRGVSETVFNTLLEYMYGREVKLDFATLKDILLGADMLCLDELVEECKLYFRENWRKAGSLHAVYQTAKELEFNDVVDIIIEGVRNYLPSSKFMELPFEFISEVYDGRSLSWRDIERELWLAKMLVKWTFHKPEERLPCLGLEVCSKLHLELTFESDFDCLLKTCHFEEDVEGDENALQTFKAGLKDLYDKSHKLISKYNLEIVVTHACERDHGKRIDHTIHIFYTSTWEWESSSRDISLKSQSVILNEDDIYLFGTKCGLKINTCSKVSKPLPPFPRRRIMSAFGVVGDTVYVIGGFNESSEREVQEILALKPDTHSWTFVKQLHERRCGRSSVISHAGYLYVVGCDSGERGKEVCLYNCDLNSFQKICKLSTPVVRPYLAIHEECLYVFGKETIQQVDLKTEKSMEIEIAKANRYVSSHFVLNVCSVKDGIIVASLTPRAIILDLVKPSANFEIEVLGVVPRPFGIHGYDWFLKTVTPNKITFFYQICF